MDTFANPYRALGWTDKWDGLDEPHALEGHVAKVCCTDLQSSDNPRCSNASGDQL